ncbi:MAG: hypothetical protein KDD25_08950, partial [Bdellovibrionales bacterium]|nr:hypothetical protein [Bdellovibrionales bacterium]
MSKIENVDDALLAIQQLSRNIHSLERAKDDSVLITSYQIQFVTHILTLMLVGVLIAVEIFTNYGISQWITASKDSKPIAAYISLATGLLLLACVGIVYFQVWYR